ncbi:AAA family ATPase [Pseudomonadota bacterium]
MTDAFDATVFPDLSGATCEPQTLEFFQLQSFPPEADEKKALPLLKLARFGNTTSPKGSLRHDTNVTALTGCELDYDSGQVSMDEAAEWFDQAGIEAFLYTSPSNTVDDPHWRVLLPFKDDFTGTVEEMRKYRINAVERAEEVLGFKVANESRTLSQAFFYGKVTGTHYNTYKANGKRIDVKYNLRVSSSTPLNGDGSDLVSTPPFQTVDVEAIGDKIASGETLHDSLLRLSASYAARGMAAIDIVAALRSRLEDSTERGTDRWQERYDSIPRLVESAVQKFQTEEAPAVAEVESSGLKEVEQAAPVKLEQPEKNIAPRFNLIRANDIDLTPPDWLVEKYIEREAIIFLYGDTEAFKTFICIDLACAIAGGHYWGAECKVKQGPVVYVCGEGAKGIRRRLAAWELHHKKPIPDNLFVSSCSTDLADPTAISVLTGELEALPGPPAAIMVDTFARNYSGSENENTDIAAFYNAVEASLVKPFSSTVLVTHHPGKNVSLGPRGGASIKQNSDAMFKVTRTDSGDQMFTTLHSEKMKDAERPVDVMFEAMEYPLGFKDSFGNESTSLALDYVSTVERQVIAVADKKDAAKEAEERRKELLQQIIEDPTLIQVDYAARTGLSTATTSRHMKKLRADKHLKGRAGRLEVTAKGKEWCRCRSAF